MEFNGHELIITYKRIKRINARIRDNRILVSAPFYTKEETIFKFLDDNKNRIEKIFLNQVNIDDNVIYVWGKKYELIKIKISIFLYSRIILDTNSSMITRSARALTNVISFKPITIRSVFSKAP